MSEWTPGSNQQEDETLPGGAERRPVPFPLASLEQLPAAAGLEAAPAPAERPPVVLFDRSLIETQVSAPPFVAEKPKSAPVAGLFGHHARRPRPVEATAEQPADDPLAKPESVRKERSSWLEIDIVNGHAVEKEYGRAYQEEVRQERAGSQQFTDDPAKSGPAADAAATPPTHVSAKLGDFATTGAGFPPQPPASAQGVPAQMPPQPAPHPQAALPDGYEHSADLGHRLTGPKKQVVSNITTVWFWLVLGIICAALLTITLI